MSQRGRSFLLNQFFLSCHRSNLVAPVCETVHYPLISILRGRRWADLGFAMFAFEFLDLLLVYFGFGQQSLHLENRNHRNKTDEEEHQRQEEADRPEEHREVEDRRIIHAPADGLKSRLRLMTMITKRYSHMPTLMNIETMKTTIRLSRNFFDHSND